MICFSPWPKFCTNPPQITNLSQHSRVWGWTAGAAEAMMMRSRRMTTKITTQQDLHRMCFPLFMRSTILTYAAGAPSTIGKLGDPRCQYRYVASWSSSCTVLVAYRYFTLGFWFSFFSSNYSSFQPVLSCPSKIELFIYCTCEAN